MAGRSLRKRLALGRDLVSIAGWVLFATVVFSPFGTVLSAIVPFVAWFLWVPLGFAVVIIVMAVRGRSTVDVLSYDPMTERLDDLEEENRRLRLRLHEAERQERPD